MQLGSSPQHQSELTRPSLETENHARGRKMALKKKKSIKVLKNQRCLTFLRQSFTKLILFP